MADVEQREASVAERVELQADGHFSPAAESHDWSLDGWPMARARVRHRVKEADGGWIRGELAFGHVPFRAKEML